MQLTDTLDRERPEYPKHIYSFSGLYSVRRSGTIEITAGRIAPQPEFYASREGLPAVLLFRSNNRGGYRKVRMLVKEVVAKAFIENQYPLRYNHVITKDNNELNVCADNLEWVDYRAWRSAMALSPEYCRNAHRTRPKPTGWKDGKRTLPDGRTLKRNRLSSPVVQYKAQPTATSVRAGERIRIFPSISAAAKATGCSAGGIRHCCEFWYLSDGMGLAHLDIKGYGRVTNPEDLPSCSRVACSPKRQFVFKWAGMKDGRINPVCVVLDYEQHFFYASIADAAKYLYGNYGTAKEMAGLLYGVAAASPMYDDPSSKAHDPAINPWPTALTRLGRVNVFYI